MPSSAPQPEQLHLASDGRTPNSPHPVLIYRQLPLAGPSPAEAFERLFDSHLWPSAWRGTVYDYHHYHSTAHEALGVASGWARVMLGGDNGQEVELKAGDALVLPAGTGHCALEASADFQVVIRSASSTTCSGLTRPPMIRRVSELPKSACPSAIRWQARRVRWWRYGAQRRRRPVEPGSAFELRSDYDLHSANDLHSVYELHLPISQRGDASQGLDAVTGFFQLLTTGLEGLFDDDAKAGDARAGLVDDRDQALGGFAVGEEVVDDQHAVVRGQVLGGHGDGAFHLLGERIDRGG